MFEQRGAPLAPAELSELARRFGGALPADYRNFMAEGDGGVFRDPNRYGPSGRGGLSELFALRADSPSFWSVESALETYRGRVPDGFVPIGDDLAGNLIVLGVDGAHTGHVFFWDHERECGEGPDATMENMEPVAASFQEFLDGIHLEHSN